MIISIIYKLIFSLLISTLLSDIHEEPTMKNFVNPGSIEALINPDISYEELILVQLNLSNDSLFTIIDNSFPNLELYRGVSTYHRVFPIDDFRALENTVSSSTYLVLKESYVIPDRSRDYWFEIKQGNQTHGTYTDDDAISYSCDCLSGASDCVKLGWDSWYNPLDYWGEAWWSFSPPEHSYINEIRVNVRGGQCDDLPLWSETYMGMRDENGSWNEDYQLSIDYTDNLFVVPEVWSEGMLMPTIGSEDNYVIDEITLQFFYTCLQSDSPEYVVASDGSYCDYVNVSWNEPDNNEGIIGYNLYRDGILITQLNSETFNFTDYSAHDNLEHEYCLASINECGESEFSCNLGSTMSSPDDVQDVEASDGLFSDYVVINWNMADNADSYKIYRDGVWLGIIDSNLDLEYIDYYIDEQFVHVYCIEGINECATSNFVCDEGFGSLGIGDINNDQYIDILDVVLIVNIILGYSNPSDDELWAADMNNDDLVNIQDIVILVNNILR